eukprot:1159103-Pelagomonas_calceolata.AAC.8
MQPTAHKSFLRKYWASLNCRLSMQESGTMEWRACRGQALCTDVMERSKMCLLRVQRTLCATSRTSCHRRSSSFLSLVTSSLLLAHWDVFPGLPWLSDFLDTVAANLPTYSRSRIVDLLEGLVALNVGLDTSVQPTRQVAKQRGNKPPSRQDCHLPSSRASGGVREESGSRVQASAVSQSQHEKLGHDGGRIMGSDSWDPSAGAGRFAAVLPRRAKWLRSVLRTFKSRRQPTARVDQLDRLQAALRQLCTPGCSEMAVHARQGQVLKVEVYAGLTSVHDGKTRQPCKASCQQHGYMDAHWKSSSTQVVPCSFLIDRHRFGPNLACRAVLDCGGNT